MGIILKSTRGSALITGMIAALSVGVVSAIILQQSQVTDKQTRIPRIKSSMMMVETQLNEALNQSVIIQPCVSGVPECFEPNHSALDAMRLEIPGAQCETPPCGVSIEDRNLSGGIFTARIVYNGTEVSIAPVNISLTTPQSEAWANATSACPDTEPFLVGFNNDGSRICRPLPADCGPGMYVSNIDPMSLTSGGVTCTAFPAIVACPAGQIMIGFTWTGGPAGFTPQCANFFNPFDPLSDPTTYAYSPPITPVYSSWPVSTTTTIPTVTTTTIPVTTTTLLAGACSATSIANFLAANTGYALYAGEFKYPQSITGLDGNNTFWFPNDGNNYVCVYMGVLPICGNCASYTTTTTMPSAPYNVLVWSSSYGVVGAAAGFCHDPKGPNYETMNLTISMDGGSYVPVPAGYTVTITCTEPSGSPTISCTGTANDIDKAAYTATVRRISDGVVVFTESGEAEYNCQ